MAEALTRISGTHKPFGRKATKYVQLVPAKSQFFVKEEHKKHLSFLNNIGLLVSLNEGDETATHSCTGTLLSDQQHVLSAGHCCARNGIHTYYDKRHIPSATFRWSIIQDMNKVMFCPRYWKKGDHIAVSEIEAGCVQVEELYILRGYKDPFSMVTEKETQQFLDLIHSKSMTPHKLYTIAKSTIADRPRVWDIWRRQHRRSTEFDVCVLKLKEQYIDKDSVTQGLQYKAKTTPEIGKFFKDKPGTTYQFFSGGYPGGGQQRVILYAWQVSDANIADIEKINNRFTKTAGIAEKTWGKTIYYNLGSPKGKAQCGMSGGPWIEGEEIIGVLSVGACSEDVTGFRVIDEKIGDFITAVLDNTASAYNIKKQSEDRNYQIFGFRVEEGVAFIINPDKKAAKVKLLHPYAKRTVAKLFDGDMLNDYYQGAELATDNAYYFDPSYYELQLKSKNDIIGSLQNDLLNVEEALQISHNNEFLLFGLGLGFGLIVVLIILIMCFLCVIAGYVAHRICTNCNKLIKQYDDNENGQNPCV